MLSAYEVAILGDISPEDRSRLIATIGNMVGDFAFRVGADLVVHDGASVGNRDKRAAFAAVYFGGPTQADADVAASISSSGVPVIPTVGPGGDFGAEIPGALKFANGLRRRSDDPEMVELAAALLECVGLLRRQRRLFVSYRRVESRAAAVQLHDLMGARGFDVFLDTHDIRPGEPFQDELWHRLCDSDVLVMLDTATYFDSKWTKQEIGRALAKDIHVLRVVWPGVTPSRFTDISTTVYLEGTDLGGNDGPLRDEVADEVVHKVEGLRSRSIASRYLAITGKLRAEVNSIGSVEGVGAHRAISLKIFDTRYWAYPVVGIPSAELLYDVSEKARRADQSGTPILVYDQVGIREAWNSHLRWLDENIRSVRAVKVAEAGWTLAGMVE